MAIRTYNKTTAGRRNASVNLHSEVTKFKPEKSLLQHQTKSGGRNHHGKLTSKNIGGGAKQRYRIIDFKRHRLDEPAKVVGIEYDPNRSSNIALIEYPDGQRNYILACIGLQVGQNIIASSGPADPRPGVSMKLGHIPAGQIVHNIELVAGKGGQLCRSAGNYARLTNKDSKWATLVLPSGEIRQISIDCRATVGQLGNTDHGNISLGKAGRNRHKGRRPHVRGMAKAHHAHPMGGGEGRSKGNRPPASKTGVLSKGGRTRTPGKASNKRILRRRFSKRYGQLTLR